MELRPTTPLVQGQLPLHLRGFVLLIALFVGGLGVGALAPAFGHALSPNEAEARLAQPASTSCAEDGTDVDAEPFVRTELFFGTSKPDGTAVTEQQWRRFLDEEITTRFPAGLTVVSGAGQWQEEDGDVIQERSKVVILLYPAEFAVESDTAIEAIRAAYVDAFDQSSVLRGDDAIPVCVSF
jgi:hypothetical protein